MPTPERTNYLKSRLSDLPREIRSAEDSLKALKLELSTLSLEYKELQISTLVSQGKVTHLRSPSTPRSLTLPPEPTITTTKVQSYMDSLDSEAREVFISSLLTDLKIQSGALGRK